MGGVARWKVLPLFAFVAGAALGCTQSGNERTASVSQLEEPAAAVCEARVGSEAGQYDQSAALVGAFDSSAAEAASWQEESHRKHGAPGHRSQLREMSPDDGVVTCFYHGDFGPVRGGAEGPSDANYTTAVWLVVEGETRPYAFAPADAVPVEDPKDTPLAGDPGLVPQPEPDAGSVSTTTIVG